MNSPSKSILKTVVPLLALFVAAKTVATALLFFLPESGINMVQEPAAALTFRSFDTNNAFKLKEQEQKSAAQTAAAGGIVQTIDTLELKAVYNESENQRGFIVVSDKSKNGEIAFIELNGQYGQYTLVELRDKEAIFKSGGQHYSLMMDEKIKRAAPAPAPTLTSSGDVIRVVPRKEISKYRKNYDLIWKSISIVEEKKDNRIIGFRVKWIKKNSVFDKLGLEANDLIKKINNRELDSYAKAFDAYRKINKMDSLSITVMRKNRIKELEYELD